LRHVVPTPGLVRVKVVVGFRIQIGYPYCSNYSFRRENEFC